MIKQCTCENYIKRKTKQGQNWTCNSNRLLLKSLSGLQLRTSKQNMVSTSTMDMHEKPSMARSTRIITQVVKPSLLIRKNRFSRKKPKSLSPLNGTIAVTWIMWKPMSNPNKIDFLAISHPLASSFAKTNDIYKSWVSFSEGLTAFVGPEESRMVVNCSTKWWISLSLIRKTCNTKS